jgi:uncharacterized protein YwlG (UPF0340 family)
VVSIGGIEMKKKLLDLSLAIVAAISLVGCGTSSDTSSAEKELTAVQKAVQDAETLSRDELMKKAAAELGDAGQLKVLAVTSRGGKDAPKNKFIELLQAAGSKNTAPVKYESTVDGKIYTTLCGEIEAGITDGYSGAILQDGYQLQKKFIDAGYQTTYVPKEWKEDSTTIIDGNDDPFTLQYNFKTWMANNKNGDTTLDNVWDITLDKYKGKLQTMDPSNENVNMDWLIMLTQDKTVADLKAAYNDASNDNKTINLDDYNAYATGDTRYAYAFIDKYITNAVFNADDGAAVDALAKTPGSIGWIVYSKIQNIKETAEISKKNIVISALGNSNTDGKTIGNSSMKGFGGFMYKHYMSVMPNAKYPYATCAFFNVLATTPEGYSAWAADVGDYPTMQSINKDRSMNGHGTLATTVDEKGTYAWTKDATKENVFPCLNDPSATWWNDSTKGDAIVETPSYIGSKYNMVKHFIDICISKKN